VSNEDELTEAWLEFHDLEVSEAVRDGTTLILRFVFACVFTDDYMMYGDRAGELIFTDATSPDLPSFEEGTLWISTGVWQTDDATGSNILPVAGLSPESGRVGTQLVFDGGQEWGIESAGVRVIFTGYSEPRWAIFPTQIRKYYGQKT